MKQMLQPPTFGALNAAEALSRRLAATLAPHQSQDRTRYTQPYNLASTSTCLRQPRLHMAWRSGQHAQHSDSVLQEALFAAKITGNARIPLSFLGHVVLKLSSNSQAYLEVS
jgi:hypothetical protein